MTRLLSVLGANWQHIAVAALLGFAIWKIDQNGYNRAKNQAEAAERARQEMERRILAKIETKMTDGIVEIDRKLADRIGAIEIEERTVVMPTIQKEIRSDPRYTDPAAGISDGMLDAINRARRASHSAAAGERQ